MANRRDWLDKNHSRLYSRLATLHDFMSDAANRERIGFEPTSTAGIWYDTLFLPAYQAYAQIYPQWENVALRTLPITNAFKTNEKQIIALYRTFYRKVKNDIGADNSDLEKMELPTLKPDTRRRPPKPDSLPRAEVSHSSRGCIRFTFLDSKTRGGRPHGVAAVEIRWAILDRRPTTVSDLVHSEYITRPYTILSFDYGLLGQTLYYAFRYINTRGERGVCSAIESVVLA
jgi:hypothetical protein